VNTGTARIVLIVALLVTGGLLLANGFDAANTAASGAQPTEEASPAPSPTGRVTETDSPPPPPEKPDPEAPKDTPVTVYNGTDSVGLAGIVLEDLEKDGYVVGQEAQDALTKPVDETVVYYVGGGDADQNKANATALAKKYYPDAKVKELDAAYDGVVAKDVEVLVILGLSDVPAAG
jgi:hypothetical protein